MSLDITKAETLQSRSDMIREQLCNKCEIYGWCRPVGRQDCEEVLTAIKNTEDK